MTFLQPILLWALPLVALPVVIHLVNQRRFQTVRWAAMMFLLAANRMASGFARLRQMLILLARMLVIAGLIFAVSRPLSGGWLGRAAGGRADTTIVLLDRSPSMRQQGAGTIVSKLESGRRQLAQALGLLGSDRWVLVESASNKAQEIASPDALVNLPEAEPAGAAADLPAMLEAARDFVRDNRAGRTEVWLCSDLRHNDWDPDGVRWQALRDSFRDLPVGVRFHLLAYPDVPAANVAVRVTRVRRQETSSGAELLVCLKLTREGGGGKLSLPVQFEIEGARSELTVEMEGPTFELIDHRIPVERSRQRGWGRVSVPADANPGDNDFYFVFDRPQPRRALVVSDDPQAVAALQLAAMTPPDSATACSADQVGTAQAAAAEWDSVSLVVWHAPLPSGDAARTVEQFLQRGGQVWFVPPRSPGSGEFLGAKWKDWTDTPAGVSPESWRGDQDLLANTQSGAALPVGELRIRRACGLEGEFTPLATLPGGRPLLARVPTARGGVYFCATTTDAADSTLAANGVALYVAVQRALAAGSAELGTTRQLNAGDPGTESPAGWKQVAGPPEAISTDYAHFAGVYTAGDRLLAVNRPATEDTAAVLDDDRLAGLFQGLDFSRVNDRAGGLEGLIQEIWRPFLVVMIVAMLAEAALCLPRRAAPAAADRGFPGFAGGPTP
jgi:hypothetical protein